MEIRFDTYYSVDRILADVRATGDAALFEYTAIGGNMTQVELVNELKKLTVSEQLAVIERALKHIREDLKDQKKPISRAERRSRLAAAAKRMLPEYQPGGELTEFTRALEGEDFYEEG